MRLVAKRIGKLTDVIKAANEVAKLITAVSGVIGSSVAQRSAWLIKVPVRWYRPWSQPGRSSVTAGFVVDLAVGLIHIHWFRGGDDRSAGITARPMFKFIRFYVIANN
jgi:hypothetical protein